MNAKSSNMSSVPVAIVDATKLKMSLGTIFDRVLTEDLKITKHGNPQAVVMSVERYERLSRLEPVDVVALETLRAEFDVMYANMQTRKQEAAMNGLMDADEDDITSFLGQHYEANPVPPMAKETAAATGSKPSKRPPVSIKYAMPGSGALASYEVISPSGRDIKVLAERSKRERLVAAALTKSVLGSSGRPAKPAATMVKARPTQKKGAK